jgi:hypothetical protein
MTYIGSTLVPCHRVLLLSLLPFHPPRKRKKTVKKMQQKVKLKATSFQQFDLIFYKDEHKTQNENDNVFR